MRGVLASIAVAACLVGCGGAQGIPAPRPRGAPNGAPGLGGWQDGNLTRGMEDDPHGAFGGGRAPPASSAPLATADVDAVLRSLPLAELGAAVTDLHRGARLLGSFDWSDELRNALSSGEPSHLICFGIDPDLLPAGSEIRPGLADAAEVYAAASNAVAYANRYRELTIDPSAGLASLQQEAVGKAFSGCYLSSAPDFWMGHDLAFFVDAAGGLGVLAEIWWAG